MTRVGERFKLSDSASLTFDLLRAGAAQMVLLGHVIAQYKLLPWLQRPHLPDMQNLGVLVFFFISGMLICHSVASNSERGGYDFKRYLFDRTTRIYSGLLPALVFIAVADALSVFLDVHFKYAINDTLMNWVGSLFFLQEYPRFFRLIPALPSFGSGVPLWKLAVEWALYVVAGFLLLSRPGLQKMWGGALFLLCAPIVFLHFIGGRGDGLAMIWFLGFGAMLALRHSVLQSVKLTTLVPLFIALAGFSVSGFDDMIAAPKGYYFRASVLVCFAVFALIVMAQNIQAAVSRTGIARTINFLANYSYTLYLTHFTTLMFAFGLTGEGGLPTAMAVIVVCNIVAAIIAYYTEMRLSDLRRVLSPRRL